MKYFYRPSQRLKDAIVDHLCRYENKKGKVLQHDRIVCKKTKDQTR
jgi:hypothetical protein